MTTMTSAQHPAKPQPQPDIYTLLLIVAIVFLIVTAGIVIHDLMTTYGMTFVELFKGQEMPSA